MERQTQQLAILKHLKTKKSITSLEAIEKYGATRLGGQIFALRKKGYNIITQDVTVKNRFGDKCTIAKYVYLGEINERNTKN